MKILPIEQGTPEAKELRRTKIGASDIATIMEGSPREIYNLYLEKVEGKERYVTEAMARGTIMEDEAREWLFGNRLKIKRPIAQHDNPDFDWLIASLDAYHEARGLLAEIKCPSVVPEKAIDYPRYKRAWWQLQAQMFVTGLQEGLLLIYSPLVQTKEMIRRDEDAINKLLEKGLEFYFRVKDRTPPPKPADIEVRDEEEVVNWANEFRRIDEQLKALEEQKAMLREEGIRLANGNPFECDGVKVELTKGRETYDYKAAIKTYAPDADLSQFLKASSPSWRVTA